MLRCCLIHVTIIILRQHFIFSIFVSISRSRSIYAVSMWSIFVFSLAFVAINHITSSKQTHLFWVHFLECLLYCWDNDVMKKANIFLIAEVQPRSVAQFLFEYLLISAWRCLWKFTYKKSVYLGLLNHLKSTSLCHWLTAFNINHSHKELHLKCFGGSRQVPILSEIAVLVETVTNGTVIRKQSLKGIHFQ